MFFGILSSSEVLQRRAVPVLSSRMLVPMTAKRKLTEATVSNVATSAGRIIIWDAAVTGFGLRCSSSGAKSFVLVYRPQGIGRGGSSRTITLGRWPELSVEAARKAARAKIGEIAHGKDPALLLRASRHSSRLTLGAAIISYEASLRLRRVVIIRDVISSLHRGLANLLRREIGTITRADYVAAINRIEAQGKLGAAQYLRKNARTFAEWAVTQGLCNHNPLAGLRRPKATRAERLEIEQRGRALSASEIASLWHASQKSSHAFGGLVRLGLLTGMRRGELGGLTWSDVTSDRIKLPATHTKQGRVHEIPLSPLMREVIGGTPRETSQLVFPSPKTGGRMSGWNKLVAKLVHDSGVDFKLHDLRRTCRTLMTDTGTPEDIAEIAIGHQRDDLVRRYNFSEVWTERAQAFNRVSSHINDLIGGQPATLVLLHAMRSNKK